MTIPSKWVSFGQAIRKARKAKGLTQKGLAALVIKQDRAGDKWPPLPRTSISVPYLSDIERGYRRPTADHIIRQFAQALDEDERYLFALAGKIPDGVRKLAEYQDRDIVIKAFSNFMETLWRLKTADLESIRSTPTFRARDIDEELRVIKGEKEPQRSYSNEEGAILKMTLIQERNN